MPSTRDPIPRTLLGSKGRVVYANDAFLVLKDDAIVTLLRHDGSATPDVGTEVAAGWSRLRKSGWPAGDDDAFFIRPLHRSALAERVDGADVLISEVVRGLGSGKEPRPRGR